MEEYVLKKEFITLGMFLKEIGAIDTGGAAKRYLADQTVLVMGEEEDRRGRKLKDGMNVELETGEQFLIRNPNEEELQEMKEEAKAKEALMKKVALLNKEHKKKSSRQKQGNKQKKNGKKNAEGRAKENASQKKKSPPRFPGQ